MEMARKDFEMEREEWQNLAEMEKNKNETEMEKLFGEIEEKEEEMEKLKREISMIKEENLSGKRGIEEELGKAQKENERLSQNFMLEKMRIENSIQLKDQDINHLKEQLKEKKEQMEKQKNEMEGKIKNLEGSKGKLLLTLRKDFEEERMRMKSDFEQKKRNLKEKVLNLTSIISQKDQEIDSHMASLKISHKGKNN
jgi:uncharacterized protein (DUF3084 family)